MAERWILVNVLHHLEGFQKGAYADVYVLRCHVCSLRIISAGTNIYKRIVTYVLHHAEHAEHGEKGRLPEGEKN